MPTISRLLPIFAALLTLTTARICPSGYNAIERSYGNTNGGSFKVCCPQAKKFFSVSTFFEDPQKIDPTWQLPWFYGVPICCNRLPPDDDGSSCADVAVSVNEKECGKHYEVDGVPRRNGGIAVCRKGGDLAKGEAQVKQRGDGTPRLSIDSSLQSLPAVRRDAQLQCAQDMLTAVNCPAGYCNVQSRTDTFGKWYFTCCEPDVSYAANFKDGEMACCTGGKTGTCPKWAVSVLPDACPHEYATTGSGIVL